MKKQSIICRLTAASLLLTAVSPASAIESLPQLFHVQFPEILASEFVRFVSKATQETIIFDARDLHFPIEFSTTKPISHESLIKALGSVLRNNGFAMTREGECFVIARADMIDMKKEAALDNPLINKYDGSLQFYVHKLQYQEGAEIEASIKSIASEMSKQPGSSAELLAAIHTMQWIKTTNTLIVSGEPATIQSIKNLIENLDRPQKQVFIEVLVIETDARNSSDFGIDWAVGGAMAGQLAGGLAQTLSPSGIIDSVKMLSPTSGATNMGQVPLGKGFDVSIIGDVIKHKGKSYLSLGAFVSALQHEGGASIVLNQKIITQDNKNSKIFSGDNIPYANSVIHTTGQVQQTTANIDYRDVGVSLSITPMLGDKDIITLNIEEEISESTPDAHMATNGLSGIRTTKTSMVTSAHVPDRHFLILSGMMRNINATQENGVPVLSKIPLLGGLFRKEVKSSEKRNIIIFVKPHIIHNFDEYQEISVKQGEILGDLAPN